MSVLKAIDTNIKAVFKTTSDNYTDIFRGKIYDTTRVTGATANIIALADVPGMREWKSERVPGLVKDTVVTITPRKYEATIAVTRENIEDDDFGFITNVVRKLTTKARKHYGILATQAYVKGFTANLSDGTPFFDNSRGNLQAGALTAENFDAARQKLATQSDSDGVALGYRATVLLVGPQNEAAAEQIIKAQTIEGTTNINYNRCEIIVNPAIAGLEWFVIDNTEGYLPITIAERVAVGAPVAKNELNSDNAFDRDIYEWGLRGRYDPAYVDPALVVGSIGS